MVVSPGVIDAVTMVAHLLQEHCVVPGVPVVQVTDEVSEAAIYR